ncbi:MAG TPA: c-type cytochrome [Spirochaetota bacterium]|nr:c-type cytochrome [Spirochaetota bacterium]HPS87089.1 c-type cytochrome [Spirochaetota bacterium]
MKKLFVLLITLSFTVSLFAAFKNLQVFPKNISDDQLKSTMKTISAALGVKCDYCHIMTAPEKDTPKKLIAVKMFKMSGDINARYSADFASKKKVGCVTCHNGQKIPQMI